MAEDYAYANHKPALILTCLEWFGNLGLFLSKVLSSAVTRPTEWRELIRQMEEVGSRSVALVALAGAALGAIISMQTQASLARFGAKSLVPAVITLSLIRESGPIITGLIACGRVGAGIGAELGSMKVTEQIDAMEVLAVNPYKLLAGTRILACTLMLPLLTILADSCGIFAGWLASSIAQPMTFHYFINNGFNNVDFSDLLPATLKTAIFGFIIGVVSSFQGMRTEGGTEGVGRSVRSSVVLSSLLVIVADVLIVRLTVTFFG